MRTQPVRQPEEEDTRARTHSLPLPLTLTHDTGQATYRHCEGERMVLPGAADNAAAASVRQPSGCRERGWERGLQPARREKEE